MSPLLNRGLLCLGGLAVGLAQGCGGGDNIAPKAPNRPPAAVFVGSCAGLECTFADRSTDADGRIVAYRWGFGDGSPAITTRNASHVYAAPGTYPVVLRVTDDSGATDSLREMAHAALPEDVLPVAAFGSACQDLACTFTDSSSDSDGRVVGYRWSFGDGSGDVTTRSPVHTYPAGGSYAVALTVTDDRGRSAVVSHTVVVVAPDIFPRAAFGSACVRLTCTFTDSSSDADGSVVGHHWDFGDGGADDAENPVHTYAASGQFQVQLTVTDDRGGTGETGRNVVASTYDHPGIELSSDALYYCFHPGATRNCVVLTRQLLITSSGRPLTWTATADQPWITISQVSGTTPTTVKISVPGVLLTYPASISGTVTISASGAFNSPQNVRVVQNYFARP
jgi:PKD repeat protein